MAKNSNTFKSVLPEIKSYRDINQLLGPAITNQCYYLQRSPPSEPHTMIRINVTDIDRVYHISNYTFDENCERYYMLIAKQDDKYFLMSAISCLDCEGVAPSSENCETCQGKLWNGFVYHTRDRNFFFKLVLTSNDNLIGQQTISNIRDFLETEDGVDLSQIENFSDVHNAEKDFYEWTIGSVIN